MEFHFFLFLALGQVVCRASPQYPLYSVYMGQPYQPYPYHRPAIFAPQPPLVRRVPVVSPLLHNSVTYRVDPEADADDALEVAQFHSQDAAGRVVFGFNTPDQTRMEARALDGSVRGSYSYQDPTGKTVRMHYWDDGTGFHAAGNNLPVSYFSPPTYTAEVQAARERHFQLYQEALAATLASGPGEESQPQAEDSTVDRGDTTSVEASADQVEDDSTSQQQSPDYDADSDAVAIDSDADYSSLRMGSGYRGEPEAQRKQVAEVVHDPTDLLLDTRSNLAISRIGSDGYQYLVPVASPPYGHSESLHATLYGAIPVAAVHDAQVSPAQRDNIEDHQVKPVLLKTGLAKTS